jgi:hypothetical protein
MTAIVPDDVRRYWDVAFFGVRDPQIELQQRRQLAQDLYLQRLIGNEQLQLWRALRKI